MSIPRLEVERFCTHEQTEPRLRVRCNGSQVVVLQCLHCGGEKGAVPKRHYDLATLAPFSEELLEDGNRNARAFYGARADALRAQHEREKAALHDERSAAYRAYLQSEQWAWVKRKALERDNYCCQHCGCGVGLPTSNAHHILPWGYTTWRAHGYSMLYEVVTLCLRCHARAHGRTAP